MKPKVKKPLERSASETTPKKPYSAPALTVHGDVQEITRRVSGMNTVGFEGSATLV